MKYSIFSMQVLMPLQGRDDATYLELRKILRAAPESTNYARMRDYYGRICTELRRASDRFALGVWDYWDDPSRAEGDFQDWVDGLKGKEARQQPAAEDGRPRFLAVTLALLLQHESTSDKRLLTHCDISESTLWKRDTFRHLLWGPSLVNFLHVRSHLAYMLPGEDADYGLTKEDLLSEDWHYLRSIE
jgi:hypothetical protein